MAQKVDLVVTHASQLATPIFSTGADGPAFGGGLLVLEDAAVASHEGRIVAIGSTEDVLARIDATDAMRLSAHGQLVIPGFVDAHTHPVFAATREQEFELRIQGKSYQEIARAGGGIKSSVRRVRQASEAELLEMGKRHLDLFLRHGTTTIEAKSGYGLSVEDELKLLRVIKELNRQHDVELVPTFLGAHEIPDKYKDRRDYYIDLIIREMIPAVVEEELAFFCDIFCEEHVFDYDESLRILEAAAEAGLMPKIHADQLSDGRGAELAARVGAISADHLDHVSDAGIAALGRAGVVPVLLPGAVFFLGLSRYAPARKMIEAGLPVAIATDFNPGSCPSLSMPMMMAIAGTQMRMTPSESLVAATAHGAAAIARGQEIGTLEIGKQADFVIMNLENYKLIPYHFGMNFVDKVIKNGRVVYQQGK